MSWIRHDQARIDLGRAALSVLLVTPPLELYGEY